MPHLERIKMPSILNPKPGGSPSPAKRHLLSASIFVLLTEGTGREQVSNWLGKSHSQGRRSKDILWALKQGLKEIRVSTMDHQARLVSAFQMPSGLQPVQKGPKRMPSPLQHQL